MRTIEVLDIKGIVETTNIHPTIWSAKASNHTPGKSLNERSSDQAGEPPAIDSLDSQRAFRVLAVLGQIRQSVLTLLNKLLLP
jgi:hypothetical protein